MSENAEALNAPAAAEVSFGDALQKLQRVVEEMESDELPLETMLARYEEGMKLVELCERKLAAAEIRIRQLERNAAGQPEAKEFVAPQKLDAE